MLGIGIPELLVILVIVLMIYGVGKLPEIGHGLGKAIKGFKRGVSETEEIEKTEKDNDQNDQEDDNKGKKG